MERTEENSLNPVYIHLTKEGFLNSQFRKDNASAYTDSMIRNNYALAASDLEDKGFSHFVNKVSKKEAETVVKEYHDLFIRKQGDAIFKEIEEQLDKTVNSFTYGADNKKLTGRKQTKKRVLDDIASYLSALNGLIDEYNSIDEKLILYLNSEKGKKTGVTFEKPENGLFALSKDATSRGKVALENIIKVRDYLQNNSKATIAQNKEITKIIRTRIPAWMSLIKGDIEEGIDTIIGEEMFNFTKEIEQEIKAVGTVTGQDRIFFEEGSRAKEFISKLGPRGKARQYNVADSGFVSKSDSVVAFYDEEGKEIGLIGNSIKSYRMNTGKNVTLSGSTVLNTTAVADLIETPFDYLYLNNLVHHSDEMFGAKGSNHILNRYLASKISTFILAGYTNNVNVPPLFLTYLNKIIYLPQLLRTASKDQDNELYITLSNKEINNKEEESSKLSDESNAYIRSKKAAKALRSIKLVGGFRGSAVQ